MSVDPAVLNAISGLQTAISNASPLASASSATLYNLAAQASSVGALIDDDIVSLDASILVASPDGEPAPQLSAWLASVDDDMTTQAIYSNVYGYVERIAINLKIGTI